LLLVSWGKPAHQVIAHIAENYLEPYAKDSVKALLGNQTLADVASWADEVRNKPEYKNTASWHYIDMSPALAERDPKINSLIKIDQAIKIPDAPIIYNAFIQQERVLTNKSSTKAQKVVVLKFLINLVGDANQPMIVAWAGSQNDNPANAQLYKKTRELQSFWEDSLIDGEGLSYATLANKINNATSSEYKNHLCAKKKRLGYL